MSGRPMHVQASTARESRRHHRGIRRRSVGGKRIEARRGAGDERPTVLFPNEGFRGGRILSRMPHHAGSRRGTAETRPTQLRADHGFKIQRREDQHHAGSSGEKTLSKDDAPQTEAETDEMRVIPYREAVGTLMWTATVTCPDVAYAAHQLGIFNGNPEPVHWRTAKRALQYLSRTKNVEITSGGTLGSCTKLSA